MSINIELDRMSSGTDIDYTETKMGQIMKGSNTRVQTYRQARINAKPLTKKLKREVEEMKKEKAIADQKLKKLEEKRAKREPKRIQKLRLKEEEAVRIKMEEDNQIGDMAIETVKKGNEKIKE